MHVGFLSEKSSYIVNLSVVSSVQYTEYEKKNIMFNKFDTISRNKMCAISIFEIVGHH